MTDESPAGKPWQKWLIIAELTLLAVGFVLIATAFHARIGDFGSPRAAAVLVAAGIFALSVVCLGLRWWLSLRALECALAPTSAMGITAKSLFYVVFLPMGAASEAFRFGAAKARLPDANSGSIMFSVLLDRLIGLAALGLIATAGAFAGAGSGLIAAALGRVRDTHFLIVALCLAVLVSAFIWVSKYIQKRIGTRMTLPRIGPALLAAAVAVIGHMLVVIAIGHAIASMNIDIATADISFVYGVSAFSALVPVSFLGLTPAEFTSFAIYSLLGHPADAAVKMAAVLFVFRLMTAGVGGIMIAVSNGRSWYSSLRHRPDRARPED